MMEIAILVYDGFDELDALAPYEVFANAARAGADCSVTIRTAESRETVTASHGLTIETDGPIAEVDPDLLVVPGGGWNNRDQPGAWTAAEEGKIPELIAAHHEAGGTVAAVCTGGMLLARAGILDGRPTVTHKSALDELRETDATVVDSRVVDAGDVITAGGVTSGLDLAFYLVEREFGEGVAEAVATEMEYQPTDDIHRQHSAD